MPATVVTVTTSAPSRAVNGGGGRPSATGSSTVAVVAPAAAGLASIVVDHMPPTYWTGKRPGRGDSPQVPRARPS